LGSIILGYKIGVTKASKTLPPHFKWQAYIEDTFVLDSLSFKVTHAYFFFTTVNNG
jgi:hypothetical protein